MGKKRSKRKNHYNPFPWWGKRRKHSEHNIHVANSHATDIITLSAPALAPSSKAVIYASELDYIAKCIQDYPNLETGGQLYGAWTASGAPRVIYTIGPGPRANHQPAFFNQDVEYLKMIGAKLKEYGLQHIGEWHSHHYLGLPHPSVHDAQTMQNGIAQLNLNRLLLCIGSFNDRGIVINPFNFARDTHFVPSQWEVINIRNRLREIIDNDIAGILCNPSSSKYNFAEEYIVPHKQLVPNQLGWFSQVINRQAFKRIIDELKAQQWINEVTPQISSDGIVTLKIITRTFAETIAFPEDFPDSPFEIERMGLIEGTRTHYSFEKDWVSAPDIQQTFTQNYNLHLKKHP
ncbi:MAG: Mov34/MPN/PAD-1 family protein [Muribaculaceae bacterium]|nr:Mov34/MPN/PAD-1 family protein [Muribaculaceae bacterium]